MALIAAILASLFGSSLTSVAKAVNSCRVASFHACEVSACYFASVASVAATLRSLAELHGEGSSRACERQWLDCGKRFVPFPAKSSYSTCK